MYTLSDRCVLETRNEQDESFVVIRNTVTGKFVEIPAVRWASFLLLQADIDESVKQLLEKKAVSYFEHFGGGYYVSVTTGISCVDLRRFYRNDKGEIKPTRQGLALRLTEWTALMNQLPLIMSFEPELLVAYPCSMREDHLNDPNIVLACQECSPFGEKST
jgi:hypothetical protein